MWLRSFFQADDLPRKADLATLRVRISRLEWQFRNGKSAEVRSQRYFHEQYDRNAKAGDFVLLLDIDGFQSVNSGYGAQIGERLLQSVAKALRSAIGDRGIVSRFEKDGFLVLTRGVAEDEVPPLVEQLMQVVQTVAIPVGELTVTRQVSVGGVPVTPGLSSEDAVALADRALVAAKRGGRNRAELRTARFPGDRCKAPSVEEVRLALQRGEIGYHIQPIVDLATLSTKGFEALMRWQRPDGEVYGPAHFLETMASAFDARTNPPFEAAHRAASWVTRDRSRFISFNVCRRFFDAVGRNGPDWVQTLIGDIPYDQAVFEMVETIAEEEQDRIGEIVAALRARGLRVALDDFGIGRSTLERLQKIPVDIVKVDKHFLHAAEQSPRDLQILGGIIALGRSVGAMTVVEGVETPRHLEMARELGADWAQGFFLGRPAAVPEDLAQAS